MGPFSTGKGVYQAAFQTVTDTTPQSTVTMDKNLSQEGTSIAEFFTGLFSALSKDKEISGLSLCSNEQFNIAVVEAFRRLVTKSIYRPDFLIALHPLHCDSEVIDEGLSTAVRRDIISFENPSFQRFKVKLNPAEADTLLGHIPGGEKLYSEIADVFLQNYRTPKKTIRAEMAS